MGYLNLVAGAIVTIAASASAQDTLGLANGYTTFQTSRLKGQIVKSSQTLASLNSSASGFDFLPFDYLSNLAFNGAHHLGDVTLRYRTSNKSTWNSVDSASARKPVTPLAKLAPGVVAGSDLAPTLRNGLPFKVTREWISLGEDFSLRVNITNTGTSTLEFGSLGLPVSINNIFTNRPAEETQDKCSFADPYIGLHAGYVRVSHLKGTGNALVIAPLANTRFEAWRFLPEPIGNFGYQSQTYEGNYEWQIHSLAWAQNEWNSSTPWNTPTSKTLIPGEVYSVGLQFALADSIQDIENTVSKAGIPLSVGIPGYVVPIGSTARLYVNYTSDVKAFSSGGAFTISSPAAAGGAYELTPTGSVWGRARLDLVYQDGKEQTIHYFIPKAAPATLGDMGNFFTTFAYYNDTSDPFGRAPSIMTYDSEVNAIVQQDSRVWIAGLSDEGGTGAYLAAAMKQFIQPVARELSAVDDFIHDTLVGTLQRDGTLGVVASSFFYEPAAVNYTYSSALDWTSWTSWNRSRAYTTRRAYNYVHPVATLWSMYRIARDYPEHGLRANWQWYLNRAYSTTQYCLSNKAANCDYGLVGLMGETVLGELLQDLKRENMTTEATALEATMQYRAQLWDTQPVPFGSEMAWDSTGQEGVYYWANYFNLQATATKAIDSILAYMPTVPHWGWNGNARRYWDFVYAAKIQQIERQLHHYGSGLNSLPMLSYYEQHPTDLYALRVAFAGNTAPLTNIAQSGFASAAFHSYPELLKWDPYSGDYGQGFLGLALGQCVYIVNDAKFGDLAFGGDIDKTASNSTAVVVQPKDALRRRVFVADLGLKIELSAGAIEKVVYDKTQKEVTLTVVPAVTADALSAAKAVVWLKQPGTSELAYEVSGAAKARGGWESLFSEGVGTVKIKKI
ncbi:hypothetical protein K491DRAFT_778756 [Lophiostoma macrostomum CBS 122681]|uniref:Glycoside hydrolase family 43 protein n=1 Tax=Lophiostoma macrostomum CBS 122681 TaxID=1314788 RepID=A0A6A6T8A7_9PLEO|nr:hypothetical protein K491DRAFT_778756 [Lophiostoma macrostomum CBS 122681]